MEHSPATTFKSERLQTRIGLTEIISIARCSVAGITDLPVDAIAHCERREDGTWKVVIDVLEGRARLGDNDMLAAFEVHIDSAGELLFCSRIQRYFREDRTGA